MGERAVWLGESSHTLDAKNRVHVPRRFHAGLDTDSEGQRVAVVTRGFDGCLFLFSEPGFRAILERLKTQAFVGAQERKMQRLFFSSSQRVLLDAAGRLVVPEKLKTRAGIEREVVMVGAVSRIEIWPKAAWEAFESENEGEFDRLDQVLCGDDDVPAEETT